MNTSNLLQLEKIKEDSRQDYLIENKTNPVRLLSIRLRQGRGRVQLSLSLYKLSINNFESRVMLLKWVRHLGTLDDNRSVGQGEGNATNGGILKSFQAVALSQLKMKLYEEIR